MSTPRTAQDLIYAAKAEATISRGGPQDRLEWLIREQTKGLQHRWRWEWKREAGEGQKAVAFMSQDDLWEMVQAEVPRGLSREVGIRRRPICKRMGCLGEGVWWLIGLQGLLSARLLVGTGWVSRERRVALWARPHTAGMGSERRTSGCLARPPHWA